MHLCAPGDSCAPHTVRQVLATGSEPEMQASVSCGSPVQVFPCGSGWAALEEVRHLHKAPLYGSSELLCSVSPSSILESLQHLKTKAPSLPRVRTIFLTGPLHLTDSTCTCIHLFNTTRLFALCYPRKKVAESQLCMFFGYLI